MKKIIQMNLRVLSETKTQIKEICPILGKKDHEIVEIAVSRLYAETKLGKKKFLSLEDSLESTHKKLDIILDSILP